MELPLKRDRKAIPAIGIAAKSICNEILIQILTIMVQMSNFVVAVTITINDIK